MKKGFTLIELLVVIVILAILVTFAVPNVLKAINQAKDETFITEAESIWASAEKQFMYDAMTKGEGLSCYDKTNLDLQGIAVSKSFVVKINVKTGDVLSVELVDTSTKKKATSTTTQDSIKIEKYEGSDIACPVTDE